MTLKEVGNLLKALAVGHGEWLFEQAQQAKCNLLVDSPAGMH